MAKLAAGSATIVLRYPPRGGTKPLSIDALLIAAPVGPAQRTGCGICRSVGFAVATSMVSVHRSIVVWSCGRRAGAGSEPEGGLAHRTVGRGRPQEVRLRRIADRPGARRADAIQLGCRGKPPAEGCAVERRRVERERSALERIPAGAPRIGDRRPQ